MLPVTDLLLFCLVTLLLIPSVLKGQPAFWQGYLHFNCSLSIYAAKKDSSDIMVISCASYISEIFFSWDNSESIESKDSIIGYGIL